MRNVSSSVTNLPTTRIPILWHCFSSLLLISQSGGLDANVNFMSFEGLRDKYDWPNSLTWLLSRLSYRFEQSRAQTWYLDVTYGHLQNSELKCVRCLAHCRIRTHKFGNQCLILYHLSSHHHHRHHNWHLVDDMAHYKVSCFWFSLSVPMILHPMDENSNFFYLNDTDSKSKKFKLINFFLVDGRWRQKYSDSSAFIWNWWLQFRLIGTGLNRQEFYWDKLHFDGRCNLRTMKIIWSWQLPRAQKYRTCFFIRLLIALTHLGGTLIGF